MVEAIVLVPYKELSISKRQIHFIKENFKKCSDGAYYFEKKHKTEIFNLFLFCSTLLQQQRYQNEETVILPNGYAVVYGEFEKEY